MPLFQFTILKAFVLSTFLCIGHLCISRNKPSLIISGVFQFFPAFPVSVITPGPPFRSLSVPELMVRYAIIENLHHL